MTPRDLQETLHETLRGGQAWSRRLRAPPAPAPARRRGRACVSALFYNARDPLERYNMPDTLKAQYTAFLTAGRVLYSDMGRVLLLDRRRRLRLARHHLGHRRRGGGARALRRRALPGAAQRLPPQRPRQPAGRARQVRPRQARPRRQRELLRPGRRRRRRARWPGRPATAAPAPPSSCAPRWTRWWCCRTRRTRSIRARATSPPPVELSISDGPPRGRGRSLPAVAPRERPRLRADRGLRRGDGRRAMSSFRMTESTLDPAARGGRRHAAGRAGLDAGARAPARSCASSISRATRRSTRCSSTPRHRRALQRHRHDPRAGQHLPDDRHALMSSEGRPLLTIVADTCGRHDTLGGACSAESNQVRYALDKKHMHTCRDSFLLALARHGHGMSKRDLPSNINFFMNVPVTPERRADLRRRHLRRRDATSRCAPRWTCWC